MAIPALRSRCASRVTACPLDVSRGPRVRRLKWKRRAEIRSTELTIVASTISSIQNARLNDRMVVRTRFRRSGRECRIPPGGCSSSVCPARSRASSCPDPVGFDVYEAVRFKMHDATPPCHQCHGAGDVTRFDVLLKDVVNTLQSRPRHADVFRTAGWQRARGLRQCRPNDSSDRHSDNVAHRHRA
jgi:hypothetical protein